MRGEQKPENSGNSRSVRTDRQKPRKSGKSKRSPQKTTRRVGQGESEDVRLAKALERLRGKYQ